MSHDILSILGLYNWDSSIFDLLVIPEGVDKENLINNILTEYAELEILYPNPEVMKNVIGIWSQKELPTWQKIYNAEQLEYNPIENYDRFQSDSRVNTRTGESTATGTINSTENGTLSQDNLHKYAGFDSGVLVNQTEDVNSSQSTNTGTQQNRSGSEVSEENRDTFTSRIHGNIGVTTSQQMLESELAVVPKLNIINYIMNSFKNRFCILVY